MTSDKTSTHLKYLTRQIGDRSREHHYDFHPKAFIQAKRGQLPTPPHDRRIQPSFTLSQGKMSLLTPKEILDRFYAAEAIFMAAPDATRDPTNMLSTLSPKIKVVQSPDLPWGGEWIGHEGFAAWGATMTSYFQSLEVLEPRVFEQTDGDEVMVFSTLRLVTKKGEVWEKPLTQIVKVDRAEGVIVQITPFYWDVVGLRKLLNV
jgi:ketosteroid isomerase-like protein